MQRRGQIPGYTGYIPSAQQDRMQAGEGQVKSPSKRIPGRDEICLLVGYQGYVPAIAAENMYGATFGKITTAVVKGEVQKALNINEGGDSRPEDRFKSSHMAYYDNPRDKVMRNPLEPEEALVFAGEEIPHDVVERFWGAGQEAGATSDKQQAKRKDWTQTFQSKRGKSSK